MKNNASTNCTTETMREWIERRNRQLTEKRMTDAKQEALRQALTYHSGIIGHFTASVGEKRPKPVSADQVVATARKFEAFLQPKVKR